MEVLDIMDELNSVKRLLETQLETLAHAVGAIEAFAIPAGDSLLSQLHVRQQDLERYRTQISRMIEDADRTWKSVSYKPCHSPRASHLLSRS